MLSTEQKNYLDKLPPEVSNRILSIVPYSSKIGSTSSEILEEIEQILPTSPKHFIGSAALEIAGENDIDIAVISSKPESFEMDKIALSKHFGEPRYGFAARYAQWEFNKNGIAVELSLNNDLAPQIKDQIDTHELLRSDALLRQAYENLKLKMNGKTYKEYQTAKYEFFNQILSENPA